jgi:hypothetical protein
MADILRLEDNIPERIALKYPTAKVVPSSMEGRPADAMYSLKDGRVMYVPLRADQVIQDSGVRVGQEFEFCKVKRGRSIDYSVRVLGGGPAATESPSSHPDRRQREIHHHHRT